MLTVDLDLPVIGGTDWACTGRNLNKYTIKFSFGYAEFALKLFVEAAVCLVASMKRRLAFFESS